MSVSRLLPIAMILSLGACAALPPPQTQPGPGAATPAVQSITGPGFTEEVLYKLLLAEIAGQRGRLDIAVANYRDAALLTRDLKVIERAARVAVYARDNEAAEQIAKLWVELDPDNIDAHQVLAAVDIRAGDNDGALKHLEHILASGEGDLEHKLWMIASMLTREQDQAAALAVMERLLDKRHDNVEMLYAYAHIAARLGDLDRSKTLLERVLELEPQNANAAMSYVSVLQRLDESEAALHWLADRVDRYVNDFSLRLLYARMLTDARRFDDARRQFEILAVQAPNNSDVLYALGLLYLQANRLDDAAGYFQRLAKLDDRTYEARYYLGRIAEEKGDFAAASDWYIAVEQGDNYFDAQVRLALLLAKRGSVEEALEHLRDIEAKTQEQKNLLIQAQGEILTDQKRYEEAMAIYDAALKDNFDIDLLYTRAMLAEKMDRLDVLESDLRRILEKEPDHAQALNALGYTLADRNTRLEEAYALIKRALELSPEDFYILDSMGWVLYRMGRLEEAVGYLRKALAIRNDPEVAAHLGEVLWVMGDREAARQVWETALKAAPDDERLLKVIKRFSP